MRKFTGYIKDYFKSINKTSLLVCSLVTAVMIFINYHFKLNQAIYALQEPATLLAWFGVFIFAFGGGYVVNSITTGKKYFSPRFLLLTAIAAFLFAAKMAFPVKMQLSADALRNQYLNALLYFPLKLIVLFTCLYLIWKWMDPGQPFYGSSSRNFNARPYLFMLVVMIPLIAMASFQQDFLEIYPKIMHIEYFTTMDAKWYEYLLYELSYGTDFISIEFFFRGFLVLAFVKWAGKDAIIPMAMFYCTIHFGKPLGECISSYFGGIVLGVITYHTGTVYGGLIVHLGIAWLMETGGFIGHGL